MLYWLLNIKFVRSALLFDQISKLLLTSWSIRVNDTLNFIDIWVINVFSYYLAW